MEFLGDFHKGGGRWRIDQNSMTWPETNDAETLYQWLCK